MGAGENRGKKIRRPFSRKKNLKGPPPGKKFWKRPSTGKNKFRTSAGKNNWKGLSEENTFLERPFRGKKNLKRGGGKSINFQIFLRAPPPRWLMVYPLIHWDIEIKYFQFNSVCNILEYLCTLGITFRCCFNISDDHS